MAKEYLIRLSVYPYIRKYLLFHYSEPFFVTERGLFPALVYACLEPVTKINAADFRKKDRIEYGAFMGVIVGEGTIRKKGCHISSANVKRINEVVAEELHEEMYRLICQLKKAGYQVDDTIREFQRMYDFDEDELPFENLKRWYYRERARLDSRAAERREVAPQFTLNFFEEAKEQETVTNSVMSQTSILQLLSA